MNYICSWFCADQKGEESDFPQSGKKSSGKSHQDIYWRCLMVFYVTSKRVNKNEKHVLFTNVKQLPIVDGKNISELLRYLDVEVVFTDFKYKTPKNYFGSFQNQFYEFSIIEHIVQHNKNQDDLYLVLDSDCLFIKPAVELFNEAAKKGFISFEIDSPVDHVINGLSRLDMKDLFAELSGRKADVIPSYHLGEFLLCSVQNLQKIYRDFIDLWPQLLGRNAAGLKKLNEEAHTLSYLYYKNGFDASAENKFIKRIWTNPVFYRNVKQEDDQLTIWHLPAEKTFGIARLYTCFMKSPDYGLGLTESSFNERIRELTGIPRLPVAMKIEYYLVSYTRALIKRLRIA